MSIFITILRENKLDNVLKKFKIPHNTTLNLSSSQASPAEPGASNQTKPDTEQKQTIAI